MTHTSETGFLTFDIMKPPGSMVATKKTTWRELGYIGTKPNKIRTGFFKNSHTCFYYLGLFFSFENSGEREMVALYRT